MDEVRLPSDVQLNMMMIHQEHLTRQNDLMRDLLYSHETEIALIWVAVMVLGGLLLAKELKDA